MSRKLLCVLFTLYFASICRSSRVARNRQNFPKIIDGEIADIKDYPYLVSLQYNGTFYGHDYDHFCCGSIINDQWIVTSAQCGIANHIPKYQARAGSSKYYENGYVYEVEKVVVHPKFDVLSRDYDFALLKVSKKIIFNESVQPIKLPKPDEFIPEDADFSIVGWGATQLLGPISDDLRKSHVPKVSIDSCRSVYGDVVVTQRMFCVFAQGYGPCIGDSGSPAVLNNELIGVASWSYDCAYEKPTVYAKISTVLSWIKENTKSE